MRVRLVDRDCWPDVASGRALRSPGQVRGGSLVGLCFVLLGVMRAAAGDIVLPLMACGLGLLMLGLFAWWTGVWMTAEGIRVRNPLSGFELGWGEIRCFRIGGHGPFRACCVIELTDRSTRYAFAIQVSNWAPTRANAPDRQMVAALNFGARAASLQRERRRIARNLRRALLRQWRLS
jgi:hypothetical protein